MTFWSRPTGWPGRASAGLALAIAAVVTACSGGGRATRRARGGGRPARGGPAYERVGATVLPSVVQITTPEGLGSGVVLDAEGDIVTNAHVVGSAKDVRVRLPSGSKTLAVTVLGVFAPDDLAVIRVQGSAGTLRPATFGRSSAVRVGEIVLAMGN